MNKVLNEGLEVVADNSQKSRLEFGLGLSHLILSGEQSGLWTHAHRDDGRRVIVRADEKLDRVYGT